MTSVMMVLAKSTGCGGVASAQGFVGSIETSALIFVREQSNGKRRPEKKQPTFRGPDSREVIPLSGPYKKKGMCTDPDDRPEYSPRCYM